MKLSLQWKWFCGLVVLLGVLLFAVNLGIDFSLPPFLVEKIRTDLGREAALARHIFAPKLSADYPRQAEINALAHTVSRQTGLRVTIIAADGSVIGESDVPDQQLHMLENHLHRPEVQMALEKETGSATRRSHTIQVDLMYVAAAVRDGRGKVLGVVRIAMPLDQIAQTTGRAEGAVAAASLIVFLAALPFLFWTARRISGPIQEMHQMATRVAQGDFSCRAPEKAGAELGGLAKSLNQMSAQLQSRLSELEEEKSELNATLSNMIEGVLVVDGLGKIRLVNRTLRRQFDLPETIVHKTVMEAFRNVPLQEMIEQALACKEVVERELVFFGEEESVFDVNAACLLGRDGICAGAVVVFHDITRIKKLENMRKEFVANVSHELRTPLSIIKGYVETLLDEQKPDEKTAKQFLSIIQKHAARLEMLIADLLSISEMESAQPRLKLVAVSLRETAGSVIDELARQARVKSVGIALEIPSPLSTVKADSERLHQVFFNLIENAVKYTPAGGRVAVTAREDGAEVICCVSDNGPGISPEDLPRIFERFYRVDKARSRELGGTGLGLSIVKHIVLAHGGRVWAESEPDKGSSFFFTLLKAE